MTNVFRVDQGKMGKCRTDHNGNFIVHGILTRTGVFKYQHKDGTTSRELRDPKDVFSAESIASFTQLPITDDHPPNGRVTTDNFKKYAVGNLGDSLMREGPTKNLVGADLIIRDAKAIAKVRGDEGQPPKMFLSCGYTAEVVEDNGEYMGERYDHRQTNIRGNHVALVRNPRAGESAKLLLDSADAVVEDDDFFEEREDMEKRVIGQTRSGMDVHANHKHNESDDWTVDDHQQAAWKARDEHSKLRDTLSVAQGVDLGEDAEKKIKGHMAEVKKTHDYHKKEAMTLDAESIVVDEDGWIQDADGTDYDELSEADKALAKKNEPKGKKLAGGAGEETVTNNDGGNIVKIKRDAVTIGSDDQEMHLDSLVIEVDDDSEGALEALLDRQDELISYARQQHADAEEARGELGVLRDRADDPAVVEAAALELAELRAVAAHVEIKQDDIKGLSRNEIKRKIVDARYPDAVGEDASDGYVNGMYRAIHADAATVLANKQSIADLGGLASSNREDGKDQKPGEKNDEDEKSYRQLSRERLSTVHSDSPEELSEKFAN